MTDEHTPQPRGDIKFMLGFFLGGLFGALTLFFVGTKEGKKMRTMFEEKGEDVLDDLHGKIEQLEEKGKELVQKGEELKEQVMEQIEEKKDEITKSSVEKLDDALEQIEKIQEQGVQTTATIRKRLFKNAPKKR